MQSNAEPSSNSSRDGTSNKKWKLSEPNKLFVKSVFNLYRMKHHSKIVGSGQVFDKKITNFLNSINPAGGPLPENRQKFLLDKGKELAQNIRDQLTQEYRLRGDNARKTAEDLSSSIDVELETLTGIALKRCKWKFSKHKFQEDSWSEVLEQLKLPSIKVQLNNKRRRVSSQSDSGGNKQKKKRQKKFGKGKRENNPKSSNTTTNKSTSGHSSNAPQMSESDVKSIVEKTVAEQLSSLKVDLFASIKDLLVQSVGGNSSTGGSVATPTEETTPTVERISNNSPSSDQKEMEVNVTTPSTNRKPPNIRRGTGRGVKTRSKTK